MLELESKHGFWLWFYVLSIPDIPNVTLAINEDKWKHSEHGALLKNKSNKLFTKPKYILVAKPDDKNTRKPSNDTDEDEKMYSKVQVISNNP